jgi:prepilin-type processing-associated H-X9-DG protein
MALTESNQKSVLSAARALIGKKTYKQLDCSNFIHQAYALADLHYPYRSTDSFDGLVPDYFIKVGTKQVEFQAADVLMFDGHVGLWDPDGCRVLQDAGTEDKECKRFDNKLNFLSSRSSGNRGPDYGMMKWFGGLKAVYRWNKAS